jgi:hypothetical protein
MQYNAIKYIYPKPSTCSGLHGAMFVGDRNLQKFENEAEKLNINICLPCASIAYIINPVNHAGDVYVDVGFALRNPEDRWDRKIGRTLAQQRLDALRAGAVDKYSLTFDLKQAMRHTFSYIGYTLDINKFNQWEALSWVAIQDIVIDHVESWNSYLHRWEEDTDILFDIVNYEGRL